VVLLKGPHPEIERQGAWIAQIVEHARVTLDGTIVIERDIHCVRQRAVVVRFAPLQRRVSRTHFRKLDHGPAVVRMTDGLLPGREPIQDITHDLPIAVEQAHAEHVVILWFFVLEWCRGIGRRGIQLAVQGVFTRDSVKLGECKQFHGEVALGDFGAISNTGPYP
jgi:hypothetical protein